ncbi:MULTISPECIES: site-specific integrase [Bacillus]|nr:MULTISPECIES: site-specific integrase [Bacillus]MCY7621852.1 site-specific integrase [Bacillus altitudinis]MDI6560032.1 site-specific integrase [Bacillus altitudinis]MED0850387.1 site-specific integrase [Bacillus altitudinis]CAI7725837.1 Tyrosine recombinase XerC [Bacillus altitudinis]
MGFFDSEEAALCISKLYELEPIWWRMYFLTTLIAGTRRGEGLALEWKDVDWDKGGLNISRSLSKTKNGEAYIKATKNKKSRFVSMPEWYMEDLQKYYLWWRKEKMKVGEEWEGGTFEFLFHNGIGKPFYYTTPTARWDKFRKKAEIKEIRLHDLRHTMVTLLIEAGAQMKAIQKRTGHESLKVLSDTYSHVTEKVDKDTADKFDVFKTARSETGN